MTNETLARLQKMNRQQRQQQFQELLQRHNIAPVPATVPRGGEPIEISLEEAEEREWLKNDLGYR